jgi:8-oxo-dGTP diphosphatase
LNAPIVVTAAIITDGKKVLIAKRKSTGKLPNKWEFPGGKVEAGETPESCLKREIMEEFGIEVSVGQFLGESAYEYDFGMIRLLAFRTSWVEGELNPKAHGAIEWVTPDQMNNYDFAPADIPFIGMLRRNENGF